VNSDLLNNRIMKNFVSLGSIQVLNFLFPLLLTPYLIQVVGINHFGLISFSQALITYFVTLNDYGFNLSTTREITLNKNNRSKIEQIYCDTLSTKAFLLVAGFLVFLALVLFLSKEPETVYFYLLSYTMVVGQSLFSVWLFQGMEEMKYISFINALSKVVTLVLILLLVKEQTDYVYVNLLYGCGFIVAGIASLGLAQRRYHLRFRFSQWAAIAFQLKEGWHIFISNFSVTLYIKSNIVILGLFASKEVVGFYSIAEGVINIVRQVLVVYFQAIYPHICRLVLLSKVEIRAFVRKIHVPFSLMVLVGCAGVFALSRYITIYFADYPQEEVITLIQLLSFVPFIVVLNIPANQLLLALNLKKAYSRILMAGSVLNLLLNLALSYYFLAIGTAVSVLLTEVFITVGLYVMLEKNSPTFTNLFASKTAGKGTFLSNEKGLL
jgi:polysaccharide transporter, PST family